MLHCGAHLNHLIKNTHRAINRCFCSLFSVDRYSLISQEFCCAGHIRQYEGGSICNENPFITPSTNA